MGILTKILGGDNLQKIRQPEILDAKIIDLTATDRTDPTVVPSRPCPAGHPLPYGLHHWQDAFGIWRCTECHPPASLAFVRSEILVGGNSAENEKTEIFDGGFILAVDFPGQPILFFPETTQAQRRQLVDSLTWFDRVDARKLRNTKNTQHENETRGEKTLNTPL